MHRRHHLPRCCLVMESPQNSVKYKPTPRCQLYNFVAIRTVQIVTRCLLHYYILLHFLCYSVFCVPKGEVTRTFLGLDLGIHGNIPDRLHIIVGTTNPIEAWAKWDMKERQLHAGCTSISWQQANKFDYTIIASDSDRSPNWPKMQRGETWTQVLNTGTESFWVVWLHCPQQ